MLQMVRCIKFGEILLDKNRRPFLLCGNCHADFVELSEFRKHLETCSGLENFFRKNAALIFDSNKGTQLFGRGTTGDIKEYRVYEPCEVQNIEAVEQPSIIVKEDNYIDMIEEELMDPRWYTDLGQQSSLLAAETTDKVLAYNELVEAVTPYVQFKENVKSNSRTNIISTTVCQSGGAVVAGAQTKTVVQKHISKQIVSRRSRSTSQNVKKDHNIDNICSTITNKPVTTIILSLDPLANDLNPKQQSHTVVNIPIGSPIESDLSIGKDVNVLNSKLKAYQHHVVPSANIITSNPVPPLARLSLSPPSSISTSPALAGKLHFSKQPIVQPTTKKIPHMQPHSRLQSQPQQQNKMISNQIVPTIKHVIQPNISQKQQNTGTNGDTMTAAMLTVPALIPASPPSLVIPKTKQTEQILNKLQTLGLQVKRTNPPIACIEQNAPSIESSKTDELLKKLRSKGMNVKVLNKNDKAKVSFPISETTMPAKRAKLDATVVAVNDQCSKANLNKNIIIRKVK